MFNTIFDNFTVDGINYYKSGNTFYADNTTVREQITLKQYKNAMIQSLAS